jgi:hypothetical protein
VADIIDAVGDPGSTCAPTHNAGIAAVSTSSYSAHNGLITAAATACPGGFATGATWAAGAKVLPAGVTTVCGSLKIGNAAGDTVTVSTPAAGSTVVIYNGDLNLKSTSQGANLVTGTGSGLAIVFAGNGSGATKHNVTMGNSSVLDIAAPTSGSWAGIAVYQDSSAAGPTTNIDQSMAPATSGGAAWKVTGLIYMPKANVSLSGGVVKSTAGQACFSLVANSFAANGNYSIYSDSQTNCAGAGLTPPTSSVGGTRQSLVK